MIAHRLSTVRAADTIVVLEAGRIVQRGTYDELMDQPDGLFHRLARRQLVDQPERSDAVVESRQPDGQPATG